MPVLTIVETEDTKIKPIYKSTLAWVLIFAVSAIAGYYLYSDHMWPTVGLIAVLVVAGILLTYSFMRKRSH